MQSAASSTALPPDRSRVPLRDLGAPGEDKRRAKSSGAQAVASVTPPPPPPPPSPPPPPPPPPRQSRVSGNGALIKEKRGTKSGGALPAASSPDPPSRQSRVAVRADGAQMEEKRRTKSAATRVAPPSRQGRVALRADRTPKEEKGGRKIGSTQVDTSSPAPPARQSRATMSYNGTLIEDKKMTKSGATHSVTSSTAMPPRRGRVALLPNGLSVDGVARADVLEFYTHRDEAIYRSTDSMAKLYRLHDTTETGLEAMMRSEPTDDCSPNWKSCEVHYPCTMMQIFSLKLAYPPPAGDQVEVYGFMAVRDTLDPLRNYVFNRSRDDPFVVEQEDGLIQISGPKRGIRWHDMALVEFDMRIKRGGDNEEDDLQLIDGAVWFNDRTSTHARVATKRIDGDYGSVDIRYALLHTAMEATVQIAVSELLGGFSLRATAFYISGLVQQEMQLFDGVVPGPDGCQIYKLDKSVVGSGGGTEDEQHKYLVSSGGGGRYEPEKCAVAAGQKYEVGNKYVIAFPRSSKLALKLKICQSGGSSDCDEVMRLCISPASTHGSDTFSFDLGFATMHVKISWSTLPRPRLMSGCCRRS